MLVPSTELGASEATVTLRQKETRLDPGRVLSIVELVEDSIVPVSVTLAGQLLTVIRTVIPAVSARLWLIEAARRTAKSLLFITEKVNPRVSPRDMFENVVAGMVSESLMVWPPSTEIPKEKSPDSMVPAPTGI